MSGARAVSDGALDAEPWSDSDGDSDADGDVEEEPLTERDREADDVPVEDTVLLKVDDAVTVADCEADSVVVADRVCDDTELRDTLLVTVVETLSDCASTPTQHAHTPTAKSAAEARIRSRARAWTLSSVRESTAPSESGGPAVGPLFQRA